VVQRSKNKLLTDVHKGHALCTNRPAALVVPPTHAAGNCMPVYESDSGEADDEEDEDSMWDDDDVESDTAAEPSSGECGWRAGHEAMLYWLVL
jgi:hypothetical protein